MTYNCFSTLWFFLFLLLGSTCLAQEFVVGGYRAYALLGEARLKEGLDYISFTGDFGFRRKLPSDEVIARHLAHEASLLSKFKLSVVNLEFALPGFSGTKLDKKISKVMVNLLTKSGYDLVTHANNHAWDYGLEGLRYNATYLEKVGLEMIGTRDLPVYEWEIGGHLIAIYALTDSTDQEDPNRQILTTNAGDLRFISELTSPANFRIAFVHLGSISSFPSPHEREVVERILDAGADLVVCTGSHFFKGFMIENGNPVVYGLGNHLFSYVGYNTEPLGMHLVAGFRSGELQQLFVVPFWNTIYNGKTGSLDEPSFVAFKEKLLERSTSDSSRYFSDPNILSRLTESLANFDFSDIRKLKIRYITYTFRVITHHYPIAATATLVLILALFFLVIRFTMRDLKRRVKTRW